MRHERWVRLLRLWGQEAGRTDPMIDPGGDGIYSCGERIGEWGVNQDYRQRLERLHGSYARRRDQLIQEHIRALNEFDRKRDRHVARYERRAGDQNLRVEVSPVSPSCAVSFVDGNDRVELARFIGKRVDLVAERRTKKKGEHAASMLLNGDGFDNRLLQTLQTNIRERAQTTFGRQSVMIVPYMALEGAGIEVDSIKRIQVTEESFDTVTRELPKFSKQGRDALAAAAESSLKGAATARRNNPQYWTGPTRDFTADGRRFQVTAQQHGPAAPSNGGLSVWHQPLNGAPSWHAILTSVTTGKMTFREQIHRLGSAVFSAIGPDGERHRYISSFDPQETPPMYFLAQLPDKGKVLTYDEAIDLLAPPIVHQARNSGKAVFRQGDVFFVETKLTMAELRRRGAVISEGRSRIKGDRYNQPVAGRNIYNTGHTGTRVARLPNGVTFANGAAEHHPEMTEPGRPPEHMALRLTGGNGWFLCIRNTVPRNNQTTDSSAPTSAIIEATLTEGSEVEHDRASSSTSAV